jgi:hypothetical protein
LKDEKVMISYSGLIGLQKMYSQRQRRNNESKKCR